MAFMAALRATSGPLLYITDSAYVLKGVGKLQCHLGRQRTNRGLWLDLQPLLAGRDVVLVKQESHLAYDEAMARGFPALAWIGNACADALAGEAAQTPIS